MYKGIDIKYVYQFEKLYSVKYFHKLVDIRVAT